MIKNIIFFLITFCGVYAHSMSKSDTIVNWQLYKNGELQIKSNIQDSNIYTVKILDSESISRLTFLFFHENNLDSITRKIELLNESGNPVLEFSEKEYSYRPFWMDHEKIIAFMKENKFKTLLIRYSDSVLVTPVILGKIEIE